MKTINYLTANRLPAPTFYSKMTRSQNSFFWVVSPIAKTGELLLRLIRLLRIALTGVVLEAPPPASEAGARFSAHDEPEPILMAAINQLLEVIRKGMEDSLQILHPSHESWVKLTNVVSPNGDLAEGNSDKIIITVVSIQADVSVGSFVPPRLGGSDSYYDRAPPLYLDVHILIVANFCGVNYPAGLEMLSRVISFFQQTPVLNSEVTNGLPPEVEKLVVELVNLDLNQANNVVMLAGLKGLPFLVYRLRRIPFEGKAIRSIAPPARDVAAAATLAS